MKKILLIIGILISQLSFGRKIYVSSTIGNDTRTITQVQNPSTPWATLSKVQGSLSSLGVNDSIFFMRGNSFGGTLRLFNKTRMYFGSYGIGDNPIFWGTGSQVSVLFRLTTCSNITFDGLTISDTTISSTDRTTQAKIQIVFILETSSQNNRIVNCKMDRIGYGVYITSSSRGQIIESCDIGNLRMIKNTPKTINPDDDYGGVPIQISSRNNIIRKNYFHDCWSVSYDYGYDGGGIEFFEEGDTISGNQIIYNTFYDNNGTLEHGSNNDGIANNPIMNNTFAYNKVINCSSLFYYNNNGQYKTKLKNLMIYNNVVVQTSSSRTGTTRLISMPISDTTYNISTLKNNIVKISNGASVARSTVFTGTQLIHTNNIYQLTNGSVVNYTLTSTEISTQSIIWVNTSSTNPLDWDYHLTSTSPAINKGVGIGITRDFGNVIVSNPPDIGIYEYTLTLTTSPRMSVNYVKNFIYNNHTNSLYVNSISNGMILISNVNGQLNFKYSYKSGGDWVNVGLIPSGLYFAVTYGKSITFLK